MTPTFPPILSATFMLLAGMVSGCQANLGDTLANSPRHQRLTALLSQTGLGQTLAERGPYTVLAPTDAAFAKFRRAEWDAIEADPDRLRALLLGHVVPGSVSAEQLARAEMLPTLAGPVRVRHRDGKPFLADRARVLSADILASNGRIHVLDEVLRP